MIEKKILVLGKGPTQGINGTVGKKIVLTLVKQIQNFAKFYITMMMRFTCMYIKQIIKFKAKDNVTSNNLYLGSKSQDITKD